MSDDSEKDKYQRYAKECIPLGDKVAEPEDKAKLLAAVPGLDRARNWKTPTAERATKGLGHQSCSCVIISHFRDVI